MSSPRAPAVAATAASPPDSSGGLASVLRQLSDRLLLMDWRNPSVLLRSAQGVQGVDLASVAALQPSSASDLIGKALGGSGKVLLLKAGDASKEANTLRSSLKLLDRKVRLIKDETGVYELFLGFPFLEGHLPGPAGRFVRGPLVLFPVQLGRGTNERVPSWRVEMTEGATPVLNRALLATIQQFMEVPTLDQLETAMEHALDAASDGSTDPFGDFVAHLRSELSSVGFTLALASAPTEPPKEASPTTPPPSPGVAVAPPSPPLPPSPFMSSVARLSQSPTGTSKELPGSTGADPLVSFLASTAPPPPPPGTSNVLPVAPTSSTSAPSPPPAVPIMPTPVTASGLWPMPALTADEARALPPRPLALTRTGVLGRFPQGSTAIFEDYRTLLQWSAVAGTDWGLLPSLLGAPAAMAPGPTPSGTPPDAGPLPSRAESAAADPFLNTALPSDGSQDRIITESQTSSCVVVRGPPGTGKSQLISNLIVHALSRGERVLVVCQKRAALDVVYQRLDRAGLGKYLALVQDPQADRRPLYQRWSGRLEEAHAATEGRSEDDLQLVNRELRRVLDEIQAIVGPLSASRYGGLALPDLYLASSPGFRPSVAWGDPVEGLTYRELFELVGLASDLERGFRSFDAAGTALAGRRPFSSVAVRDAASLGPLLSAALAAVSEGALCLADPPSQEAAIRALEEYERSRTKTFRSLSASYRAADQAVAELRRQYPRAQGLDTAQLLSALQGGTTVLQATEKLSPFLSPPGLADLRKERADPARLRVLLTSWQAALPDLPALEAHDRRLATLSAAQRYAYTTAMPILTREGTPTGPRLREEVYAEWIARTERANPALVGDARARYDELRPRLQQLCEQRRTLVAGRLAESLDRRAAAPVAAQAGPAASRERSQLLRELTKKRWVRPVRDLLARYPAMLLDLAPCWLASPEAVSEVFPLTRNFFDLLIFDEASQLAVERGLPAIVRARRVVIAGDEQQLQPFDLFQLRGSDGTEDPDASLESQSESLLVLAKTNFPARTLRWHYRSEFPELIDFSNLAFYDGSLEVAPSVAGPAGGPPIHFVQVDGRWKDQTNEVEAEKVVDQIEEILRAPPSGSPLPTLGVITFNEPQREQILDALDARRASDPYFAQLYARADDPGLPLDARPFVKNIENVQGDERDYILFSVAYAPDASGKLRVQFGTLSMDGGENRLNVAVTRAKRGIWVIASFDPESLPVAETKNLGPKRLKSYLVYAKAVSERNAALRERTLQESATGAASVSAPAQDGPFGPPIERRLCEALAARNVRAQASLGRGTYRVDVAVEAPGAEGLYALGVETDGTRFLRVSDPFERDVARPTFLASRGWKVQTVWSQEWHRNAAATVDRIVGSLPPPPAGADPLRALVDGITGDAASTRPPPVLSTSPSAAGRGTPAGTSPGPKGS